LRVLVLPRHCVCILPFSPKAYFFSIVAAHSFYGINLNQNVVLLQIWYAGKTGTPWEKLFKVLTGNIIITVLGFVPGGHFSYLAQALQ
jgi:hypothetical protein